MSEYKYRAVNPRSDEDIKKYFELIKGLSDYCGDLQVFDAEKIKWARFHMGAIEYCDKFKDEPLHPLEENADEFAFVCELDGEFVGYIDIATYHVENGQRPEDDIGILHDIYVKDDYRNGDIAYSLLQMAVDKLLKCSKHKAICRVQADNPNRFLHFAMADNNIINESECTRRNGSKTIDYILLIDLENLKSMTLLDLAKKTAKIKKQCNQKLNSELS